MEKNITVEEYRQILEDVKEAALQDMHAVGKERKSNSGKPEFSLLGLEGRYRDREYFEREHYERAYNLCMNFDMVQELIFEETEDPGYTAFLESEVHAPLKDVLYWRVRKYTKFLEEMTPIYEVYFDVEGNLFSVEPDFDFACYFEQYEEIVKREIPISSELDYILRSWRQLSLAWNVALPYRSGDILYVDVKPFHTPFYAVYCAEKDDCVNSNCDWISQKNYDFTVRTHPLFFSSQQGKAESIGHLWTCKGYTHFYEEFYWQTYESCGGQPLEEQVIFPHTLYERITLAETCEDSILRRVGGTLKADPNTFTSMDFI